jgi:RNA polymerase sigma factor (TIGR02999 family)
MAPVDSPNSASQLMTGLRGGNSEAAGKLVELFYPELRRLARMRMAAERAGHTWQPTVLVNELYLELTRVRSLPPGSAEEEQQRSEFFALAAFLMKRLLQHHSRPLPKRVSKTDIGEAIDIAATGEESLREIDDVLARLAAVDPKLRLVVEMKVFEGLSREEIAERLGCSVRTVARHWEFAQHWLRTAWTIHKNA